MASPTFIPVQNQQGDCKKNNSQITFGLFALTSLFFIWGFLTSLNDILIPHFKEVFSLNYTQAMLVQLCFFGAYFVISLPAGRLVEKIGYQKGIVTGLVIAAFGCTMFLPASIMVSYPVFLLALFVLASGITILQVSANPYVTALGSSETASGRLTMTQAFNSLGTTIAPFFGAFLILGVSIEGLEQLAEAQQQAQKLQVVQLPYIILTSCLLILALIFSKLNLPVIDAHKTDDVITKNNQLSIWTNRNLILGAIGIFLYVGAEVSIGSFLINFLSEPHISNTTESEGATLIAYYWGGAMIGRFIGAIVMQFIKPGLCLAVNSVIAIALILIAINMIGDWAMYSILAVGLFNSIMFPTIFSLALKGLKGFTSQGSGLLCLAIVGGAIIPLLQGFIADTYNVQQSFILPMLCYIFIAYFGIKNCKEINK